MMKHISIWIGFFLVFTATSAQDLYSYRGFDAPVSVTEYGGYYYLSNAGKGKGLTMAGEDGYVSRIKSDGSQEEAEMRFITGVHSPRGIIALKGTLYVCDASRLIGFDLRTGESVFELDFSREKTRQLTGIVADSDNVYVSATDIHTIFKVDLSKKRYTKWTEVTSPCGLLIDKNQMYVCSWGTDSLPNGRLGVIDIDKKTYTAIGNYEGYLWGLALNEKKLYFSDWVGFGKHGVIGWINLETKETGQVPLTSKIGGPAGFIYDSRNNIFIIPALLEGRVYGAIGF